MHSTTSAPPHGGTIQGEAENEQSQGLKSLPHLRSKSVRWRNLILRHLSSSCSVEHRKLNAPLRLSSPDRQGKWKQFWHVYG